MAKLNKMAILTRTGTTGMIPVFYHGGVEAAKEVLEACCEDSVRASELTSRGDLAQEVFAGTVKLATRKCPEVAMDVGSVVDPATVTLYIQLGASSVVGPLFNLEIAKICNRRLVIYTSGCGSISEVGFAQEADCDLCKIFPGDVYGPNFVRDLMAPTPQSKLIVIGGMGPTRENLMSWLKAGMLYVGMGSKLFPKDKVTAGDWGHVTGERAETLAYIAEARKQVKFSGAFFTTDYTDSHRFLIVLIHKMNH